MLSRVADALYWMSRYVERAEHAARVLEVTRRLLIDLREVDPDAADGQWRGALSALGLPDVPLTAAVLDAKLPSSVHSCVVRARENGRQVRETISSEMWAYLNQAYWSLEEMLGSRRREEQMPAVLDGIQRSSFLWAGATDATMPRGEGWLFIRLGQFVERTDRLSRLFDLRWREIQARRGGRPVTTGENVEWIGLLKCCSSFEAYRLRYPTRMDERNIVDFLLLDRSFPRTLRYAVAVAAEFARRLDDTNGRGGDVARAFGRLWAEVEYTDVDEVLEQGADRFLSRVKDRLGSASLELQRTYFLH